MVLGVVLLFWMGLERLLDGILAMALKERELREEPTRLLLEATFIGGFLLTWGLGVLAAVAVVFLVQLLSGSNLERMGLLLK